MAVSDYSTTPSQNTSISGIDIAEGCDAGNINNAFRQMMADIAVMYAGLPDVSTLVPKTGGVFTGNPRFSGRGGYLYNNGSSDLGGRIFVQPAGGAVPAGMVDGDWLAEY